MEALGIHRVLGVLPEGLERDVTGACPAPRVFLTKRRHADRGAFREVDRCQQGHGACAPDGAHGLAQGSPLLGGLPVGHIFCCRGTCARLSMDSPPS